MNVPKKPRGRIGHPLHKLPQWSVRSVGRSPGYGTAFHNTHDYMRVKHIIMLWILLRVHRVGQQTTFSIIRRQYRRVIPDQIPSPSEAVDNTRAFWFFSGAPRVAFGIQTILRTLRWILNFNRAGRISIRPPKIP